MKTLFYIWLGALVVVAGSGALGAMLLHAIRLRVSRAEAWALAFLAGSALYSMLWMALGLAGLVYRGVAYGVTAALVAAALLLGSYRMLRGTAESPTPERLSRWGICGFAILFLPYLWVYLLYALHPEVSADGTYYHNGFIHQYVLAHRILPFPDTFYAALSQASEIQAMPGFAIGQHCVPGMVQLVYLLAATALIVTFGTRLHGPKTGWTAGFLFFATPVVGYVSTQALNDIATGAAFFGTFYCLHRWWTTREHPWLVPAGLLAGLAFATKFSAFLAVVGFAAAMAWRGWKHRDLRWRWAAAGCLAVAVMVLPYILRNWLWYDNPLAPFGNALFPNPNFSSWVETDYRANQRTYGWLTSYWQVPWDVAFGGKNLQGIVGPVTLLLPAGLLALRMRGGAVLLACALVALSTYPQNVGARFLIPSLPFLYLLLAMAATRWREALGALLALQAVACWPGLVRGYTDLYALILAPIPTIAQVTRETPEDETLAYRLNTYYAARWLDRHVQPGERVFAYNVYVEAYSAAHACVAHASTHCFKIADVLASGSWKGDAPSHAFSWSFEPRPLRSIRLLQTAAGKDRLDLREIRLWRNGEAIPPPPGTRWEASRNDEDLRYLQDGNLVTGWSPWEYLAPGQYVTLHFPQPVEADGVEVQTLFPQQPVRLALQTADAEEQWSTLAPEAKAVAIDDRPDLRRAATAEMYRRGFRYMFAMHYEAHAQQMEADPAAWNVELALHGQDFRVFRILPPRTEK
jgi:hypothetical protein